MYSKQSLTKGSVVQRQFKWRSSFCHFSAGYVLNRDSLDPWLCYERKTVVSIHLLLSRDLSGPEGTVRSARHANKATAVAKQTKKVKCGCKCRLSSLTAGEAWLTVPAGVHHVPAFPAAASGSKTHLSPKALEPT
jgi:hypothetical protein